MVAIQGEFNEDII